MRGRRTTAVPSTLRRLTVHSLAVLATEACHAEEKIRFLFEVHPDSAFLKTYTEAVKVLPEQIKATEDIIERYGE